MSCSHYFCSSGVFQILLTCIVPSAISYLPDVRHRHYGPVTLSIPKIGANTLVLKVSALLQPEKLRRQQKEQMATSVSAPCCVLVLPSATRGSSQHNFSWGYRQGSVAVVCYMSKVLVAIQLNFCSHNIRQVAICKMLKSSKLRNTYNRNLFLWKTCQLLFIYDTSQSRTGNRCCLWIINNQFRTRWGLSSRKFVLVNASERKSVLLLCMLPSFLLLGCMSAEAGEWVVDVCLLIKNEEVILDQICTALHNPYLCCILY